jgi:hypothetical protein
MGLVSRDLALRHNIARLPQNRASSRLLQPHHFPPMSECSARARLFNEVCIIADADNELVVNPVNLCVRFSRRMANGES